MLTQILGHLIQTVSSSLSFVYLGFMCSGDVRNMTVSSEEEENEALGTVRFNFNIESLGLVLYSDDTTQVSHVEKNDGNVCRTVG